MELPLSRDCVVGCTREEQQEQEQEQEVEGSGCHRYDIYTAWAS